MSAFEFDKNGDLIARAGVYVRFKAKYYIELGKTIDITAKYNEKFFDKELEEFLRFSIFGDEDKFMPLYVKLFGVKLKTNKNSSSIILEVGLFIDINENLFSKDDEYIRRRITPFKNQFIYFINNKTVNKAITGLFKDLYDHKQFKLEWNFFNEF